jgi:hypothetical protein
MYPVLHTGIVETQRMIGSRAHLASAIMQELLLCRVFLVDLMKRVVRDPLKELFVIEPRNPNDDWS